VKGGKDMIGIIFHPKKLKRIINDEEKHEHVAYYYKLAQEKQIDLFFYPIDHLSIHKSTVKGYAYLYQEKQLVEKEIAIPKINLLRTVFYRKRDVLKLKKIESSYLTTFINLVGCRNKYKIYRYLRNLKSLHQHIPDTERLSYRNLLRHLKIYKKVVVKPINGAFGERIYVLEVNNGKLMIHYTLQKKQYKKEVHQNKMYSFYKKYFKSPSTYLIQQWIDFKKYEGEKFDIRTSVQKNSEGKWIVTGIVTRVAGQGGIVTNVAQGGRAVSFKHINPSLTTDTRRRIEQFSLDLANQLEVLFPASADLGLDIGIDQDHKLWFIEANFCDQRYAYRESKDMEMWSDSYRIPFEYAYAQYIKFQHDGEYDQVAQQD
jgi:glutathione synthase/RimK-type ligase-like ATP-grasp enzyme